MLRAALFVPTLLLVLSLSSAHAVKLNVFIMAGQSNMAGTDAVIDPAAPTHDLKEAGQQTEAERASLFVMSTPNSSGTWGEIKGHDISLLGKTVDPATGKNFKGHGPEVGFARALYVGGIRNIAIINFTANYQVLENGHSAWVSPNSLWKTFIQSIDARLAELTAMGYTYEIKGLFWNQGIDDALLGRSQADYEADMQKIVADFRAHYNLPTLPFRIAREPTSPFPKPEAMKAIQLAEENLGNTIPNAVWIECRDLTPYVNSQNLSAQNQLAQGDRFASTVYVGLVPPLKPPATPTPTPAKTTK